MKLADLEDVRNLANKRQILTKVTKQKLDKVTFLVAGAASPLIFESDEALEKFQDIVQEELDAVEEELQALGVDLTKSQKEGKILSAPL